MTEPTNEIWLLPVGPGEPRRISPPNLQPLIAASFLSDGKRIIYVAREPGRPARTWMQDLSGRSPHPITAEGVSGWIVSPDDKWLLVNGRRQAAAGLQEPSLISMAGGEPKTIAGLRAQEFILGWTDDDEVYVGTANTIRAAFHIDKLNPFTGARTVIARSVRNSLSQESLLTRPSLPPMAPPLPSIIVCDCQICMSSAACAEALAKVLRIATTSGRTANPSTLGQQVCSSDSAMRVTP